MLSPDEPTPENETPVVALLPEPPRDRRKIIAIVSAALAVVAAASLAIGIDARTIARDEAHLWATASSEQGTEEDWARYVAFADTLRADGGLRAMLATQLTAVWARAPLAEENVLVAHAESALARGDYDALCALRAEHPGTRGAERALVLTRSRVEGRMLRYRTRAAETGLDTDAVSVVARAMEAARDEDPCTLHGVVAFTREVATETELDRRVPSSTRTVRDLLEGDLEDQTWTESLSSELAPMTGITLRHEETPDAHLRIEVASTLHPDGRALTASGAPVPGLALDGTIRLFVRPAHEPAMPTVPTRTTAFHVEALSSHALEFAAAHDETALGAIYASILGELESAMLDRVRRELGIAPITTHVRSAADCRDAEPLPIGRVVHGDTRHLFDDTFGDCSFEHEEAAEYEDCEECWDEEGEDPVANPEAVYRLVITERRRVAIQAWAEGRDLVVYLRDSCASASETELACDATGAPIGDVLEPGLYFVFVDETGGGEGAFDLVVTLHDPDRAPAACTSAVPLVVGTPATGRTGGGDDFESECGGVGAPDAERTIEVEAASRLRCTVTGDFDATLTLRSDCRTESELACAWAGASLLASIDPGRHVLVVDGVRAGESGTYAVACETAPSAGTGDVPSDTCASATPIALGTTIVDTFRAQDDLRASCGVTDGPDLVYRVDVPTRSRLHAHAGGAGTVLALASTCGAPSSELACGAGTIDVDLDPGTYWLSIDGPSAHFDAYALTATLDDLVAACADVPVSPLGPSAGSTHGTVSRFSGTCVANGPETVQRFVLAARSHVVIRSQQFFDGGLYVRRACDDWRSEIACSTADGTERNRSLVDLVLDAGAYYVFVDGTHPTDDGTFTLDIQATPM